MDPDQALDWLSMGAAHPLWHGVALAVLRRAVGQGRLAELEDIRRRAIGWRDDPAASPLEREIAGSILTGATG